MVVEVTVAVSLVVVVVRTVEVALVEVVVVEVVVVVEAGSVIVAADWVKVV